jgi:type II secretory pathway component PulF
MTCLEPPERLDSLVLYTRKFAALIGAGVQLRRALRVLQDTTSDRALASANAELARRIEDNEVLSEIMRAHPAVFSEAYVAFVHAGEIGGVLDETLALLADWLEDEREASERLQVRALLLEVMHQASSSEASDRMRCALSRAREVAKVATFCRLFERCMTAGVPLPLALSTAAEILGEPAASQLAAAASSLAEGHCLAPILARIEALRPFPVVTEMVATGEESSSLDLLLRKAAEFLDAEASHILHRGLGTEGE